MQATAEALFVQVFQPMFESCWRQKTSLRCYTLLGRSSSFKPALLAWCMLGMLCS